MPRPKDPVLIKLLTERMRQLRNTSSITQEDLIDSTHLDISRHESGTSVPTIPSILKLCKVYGITLREFFDTETFDYPPKE
jgi:hypothetical protein